MKHSRKENIRKGNEGSVLVIFVILLGVLSMTILGISLLALSSRIALEKSYKRLQALNVAEGGIEKALWEMQSGAEYNGESDNSYLEIGDFDTEINNITGNQKFVIATAYLPSKTNNKFEKKVRVRITDEPDEVGVAFSYGVQGGALGVEMSPNSKIIGNVYSGGDVIAGNNAEVTGDVFVSGNGNRVDNLIVGNNVKAHTIKDCTIGGDAYYYSSAYLLGKNNIAGELYPGSPTPEPADLPISQDSISTWEDGAALGGVIEGNYSIPIDATDTLGPVKINGDFTVHNGATLNVRGTIWVTGNVTIENGSTVQLDSSYGESGGLIIADNLEDKANFGKITVENNVTVLGSGDSDSYVMMISTNSSSDSADPAISAGNNSNSVVYYTTQGILAVNNNATIRAVTGGGLVLKNGAIVEYDEGLANSEFSGGPGGSWRVIEWQEL